MNTDQRVENIERRVENIEQKVENLEQNVKEIKHDVVGLKVDVATIKAQLPHLATHADLMKLTLWMTGLGVTTLISMLFGILNYLK